VFHTLVRSGYSFNDLKYVYTIPQVWLFYEEEKKRQLTAQRDLAIVIANACAVAQPADSQAGADKRSKSWAKFLDNLDWNELEKKATTKANPVKAIMGALGVAPTGQLPLDKSRGLSSDTQRKS
jgi:hypothetical protein